MISIVIATFNSEETLDECLQSILKQTFKNYQVIIKDGNSSDNTVNIAETYSNKFDNFVLISSADSGVYDAWNTAVLRCIFQWITFLGSDDYFVDENVLFNIAKDLRLAEADSIGFVYGVNKIVSSTGEFVEFVGEPWESAKIDLCHRMTIRHPGSFCNINSFKKINGFDSDFRIIGDYDFTYRLSLISDFNFYNYPSVCHRVGGLSIKPSRNIDVIKETFLLRKKNNLRPYYLLDKLFFKRLLLYIMSKIFSDKFILTLIQRLK